MQVKILTLFVIILILLPKGGLSQQVGLDSTDQFTTYQVGHYRSSSEFGSVVNTRIEHDEFNNGNISDPLLLIQGKSPGLSIYNRGDNANEEAFVQIRGLSSLGNSAQDVLIVIDGVLGASLSSVDPFDIQSVEVLRDAVSTAIYGVRGSNGVIIIRTKTGNRNDKIRVTFNSYYALNSISSEQKVMSSSEFVSAGGNNLSDDTDWQEKVSRVGTSQVYSVNVHGGSSKTGYSVSTNYRDVQTVLKNAGFEQLNARASLDHFAFNDKLNVKFNLAMTNRVSDYSFQEAFRYAALYNPTAPIRNSEGGYFEGIIFDNYNPLSIIKQNQNLGKSRSTMLNAQFTYALTSDISISTQAAQQTQNIQNEEFYPSTSFFRGLNRNGLARQFVSDSKLSQVESYLNYSRSFSHLHLSFLAGYSYQESEFENIFIEAGNFPTNILKGNLLQNSGDLLTGSSSGLQLASNVSPKERIVGFFSHAAIEINKKVRIATSLRRDGSTRLGKNNQWGYFPSVSTTIDLDEILELNEFDALKIQVGYGLTGSLPASHGFSQPLFDYTTSFGGSVNQIRFGNDDLKWEKNAELNFGVTYGILDNKLTGSINYYSRRITDMILLAPQDLNDPFGSGYSYRNIGELDARGIEATVTYEALELGPFQWSQQWIVSSHRPELVKYSDEQVLMGPAGAPGQGSTQFVRLAEGEKLGQIWGPVFQGVGVDGRPIFADVNGDGVVNSDFGSALLETGDFANLGNGIPKIELSWGNRIRFSKWELNAFFRGAFGHSLVNTFRLFYEPVDPGSINSYNRIKTDLQKETLQASYFSSLYVEDASFLKLDNVTVSYDFEFDNTGFHSIRAYLTAENLFTITKYQGPDPEPILFDYGPTDNGAWQAETYNPLVMGVDRRNNYLPSRSFILGFIIKM